MGKKGKKTRFSAPRQKTGVELLKPSSTKEDRNRNQQLRRSNAAGPHKNEKSRHATKQQAIAQSIEG